MYIIGDLIGEILRKPSLSHLRTHFVERPHYFPAQSQDLSALHKWTHDLLTEVWIGQSHYRCHRRQGAADLFVGDHDSCSRSRQPDLGKAQRKNHALIPNRLHFGEDHSRKRRAVGVVHDERDSFLPRNLAKMFDFIIGQHIPGRVGRTRHTNRRDIASRIHRIKINAVFKFMWPGFLNPRRNGLEKIFSYRLIAVADVFREQRKKNFLSSTIRKASGQRIKKHKEGRLAAHRDRKIFRGDLPAEFLFKKVRQCHTKSFVTGRDIIIAQSSLHATRLSKNFFHPTPPYRVHLGNMCRLAASEHFDIASTRESLAQIVHQFADSASLAEIFSKL